jgi:hypothetical protein
LKKVPSSKLLNDKNKEKYFHQILMLFLPWNDEKDLIIGFSTYEAKFDSFKISLEFDSISYNLFVKNKLELEKTTIEYSKQFIDIESNNSSNDSEERRN